MLESSRAGLEGTVRRSIGVDELQTDNFQNYECFFFVICIDKGNTSNLYFPFSCDAVSAEQLTFIKTLL